MSQVNEHDQNREEMKAEYDIRGGVRGKYHERYRTAMSGTTLGLQKAERRPKAFVIMPFDEGFDEVYNLFIAGAVTDAGYEIYRADDLRSQQNILKDVVAAIFHSDLIVADLTGANANVYYDLGLAHAFRKRVVLLTQRVDDLPFDLRSYRVIPYSTHFAAIVKARDQLVALAKDALADSLPFGSPVTDFLPDLSVAGSPVSTSDARRPSMGAESEAGPLDHLVSLEEGFAALSQILNAVTAETEMATKSSIEIVASLQTALTAATASARSRREIVITWAQRLSNYAALVSQHHDAYAHALTGTRTSLEFVARSHRPSNEEERAQLRAFLNQMAELESKIQHTRTVAQGTAEIFRGSPRPERTLNRAIDDTIRELERYAQNLDQTISMVARAKALAGTRLEE